MHQTQSSKQIDFEGRRLLVLKIHATIDLHENTSYLYMQNNYMYYMNLIRYEQAF